MPSSKTKVRGKGTRKTHQLETDKMKAGEDNNRSHAMTLIELKEEKQTFETQLRDLRKENEDLMIKKEKHLKELNLDCLEKQTLFEECLELNDTEPKKKNKKKLSKPRTGEHSLMPYELDSVKKLGSLSGRLIKELISLRDRKDEYLVKYVDEEYQMKILDELLETASISGKNGRTGRLFVQARIKEMQKEILKGGEKLKHLKIERNRIHESCCGEAKEKYEQKLRQLTDERAMLQKEFLEKEAKLKDIKEKQIVLEQNIAAKKAKIARQIDANKSRIFSSSEFADLMEQRNVLLSRIDRSVKIIEDTKVADNEVKGKIKELNCNLLNNQKRVEELTTKLAELRRVTEEEKFKTISTSSVFEYVSQELNSKNGILLQLETDLEELEAKKEMLEKNLQYCDMQRELLRNENQKMTRRITELKDQYFESVE